MISHPQSIKGYKCSYYNCKEFYFTLEQTKSLPGVLFQLNIQLAMELGHEQQLHGGSMHAAGKKRSNIEQGSKKEK